MGGRDGGWMSTGGGAKAPVSSGAVGPGGGGGGGVVAAGTQSSPTGRLQNGGREEWGTPNHSKHLPTRPPTMATSQHRPMASMLLAKS
jgi:hypothetical protein